jgi:hypothetical protein
MNNELATQPQAFSPPALIPMGIESAASAVAAQSKAMVEARYVMAMQRPRNWDEVRQKLLRECRRPAFARNKSAYYRKPIGAGVEGLGIRFVEVALRCMTNVLIETTMIFEDQAKEVHRVSVTDLESNITYPMDVRVSKTVERSKPADDGSYISMRMNSYQKAVYTVPANDDDLLNKRAALISKAVRTLGLRIIPGDLQDEAEEIIKQVRLDDAARDPDAERKRIVDAFGDLNVKASQLADYLGHDIGACSPQELVNLRGLYGAIKDGEATWASAMENKLESGGNGGATAKTTGTDKGSDKPPYPDELFAKGLPGWLKAVADKRKTADQIIATLLTKNSLSDAQKAAIRGEQPEQPADSSQDRGALVVTFAQVAAAIDKAAKAKDADALAAAGDLIGEVADPQHRKELQGKFEAAQAEIEQE